MEPHPVITPVVTTIGPQSVLAYRKEIDGLRAVAVLPVILFHAGCSTFKGGFVGVDVFFVISGYLITSIVLHEKAAGSFDLARFYERRARRILPALFLVMAVCVPFAWFWLVPSDLRDFGTALMATSAFASNVAFYLSSGYFAPASEHNPLLHTWSLAVEEQFYLIFPALLLIVWRAGTRWATAILILGAASSLALGQWASLAHPSAAFYLLPTRGWELLTGALIAIYLFTRHGTTQGQGDHISTPALLGECLGFLGLLLIGYAVFRLDSNTPYPGLHALLPTTGAAFIILFGTQETLIGKLLRTPPLAGVGLISYSAYLWHQPLFAFFRQRSFESPGTAHLLMLTGCALLLAWLSWKYIESPFRKSGRLQRRHIVAFALAGTATFIVLGAVGQMNNGFERRARLLNYLGSTKTVEHSRCHTTERRTAAQLAHGDVCTLGTAAVPSFAVIGDSHAGAVFEALDAFDASEPFSFFAISGSYCAPVLNGFTLKMLHAAKDCRTTTLEGFEQILRSPSIRDVFLVAEWANYVKGYRESGQQTTPIMALVQDDQGSANSPSDNAQIFARSLATTVAILRKAGKNVIIVEPVPEFGESVIRTLERHVLFDAPTVDTPQALADFGPTIAREEYLARNAEVFGILRHLSGVSFVGTSGLYCDSQACRSVSPAGDVLFSDTNHLTGQGAHRLARQMLSHIGMATALPETTQAHTSPVAGRCAQVSYQPPPTCHGTVAGPHYAAGSPPED